MPRPIQALIHTEALAHNLARTCAQAPNAKVWAVVKANAYGHGIERVFGGLKGADGFALLDVAEAERMRNLGWRGPILLLEGCFEARDLEACSRLHLWHVVHTAQQIDWLAAHKTPQPQRVFLKLNSGMNRLGFTPEAYRGAWARLDGLAQVEDIVLMTHFADADGERGIAQQVAAFDAATLRHPGVQADWVRAGIMLYGSAPDFPAHDIAHWDLQPTMTLRSQLIAVQTLQAGQAIGYGSSFTAETPLRVGIVACGYADGYPRHCATGTPVLVNGVRTRTVGRVSMDMLAVDLSALPDAGVGSEVTLWGEGPDGAQLPIDEIARAAGTIGYELMCALAPRVPVTAS
jgi:alanine racemase